MEKTVYLKVTSAVGIDGKLRTRGAIIPLPERLTINLLDRGKVVPATPEEVEAFLLSQAAAVIPQEPEAPAPGGNTEPKGPTRAELDAALAELPGEHIDPEYVVNGMRAHFGELFTDEDEANVRDLVKAPAPATAPAAKPAKAPK